jgi:hypothetical protein
MSPIIVLLLVTLSLGIEVITMVELVASELQALKLMMVIDNRLFVVLDDWELCLDVRSTISNLTL